MANVCSTLAGTWTADVWTPTGIWELSAEEDGWVGDFHHTDHVHGFIQGEYECYDRDVTDHVGKCSDGADTPAGIDCAANFQAADSFEEDGCPTAAPENCVWTEAPVAPNPKPPHPTAASFDGYSHMSGACRGTPVDRLFDESPKMTGRPAYIYRKNTEFPSFPDWANPTALATFCDDLNTLHAADPTTNPATCLAFHSGPWVSVFGLNIDQPGPHLPEGTLWLTDNEGSGTIDITGTKPNHQYVCYIKGNVCPGGIDTAPEGDNGCNYGACFNPLAVDSYHALRARCELLQYIGAVLHSSAGDGIRAVVQVHGHTRLPVDHRHVQQRRVLLANGDRLRLPCHLCPGPRMQQHRRPLHRRRPGRGGVLGLRPHVQPLA
jgi:hypothetical protein